MGKRQHRCQFYLLKITQKDLELINSIKSNNIDLLEKYAKQLNSVTLELQTLKGCFQKIADIMRPYIDYKTIYSLDEVIENSLLNPKTKRSTLSLIKKYQEYCKEQLEKKISNSNSDLKSNEIKTLYDPQNAYNFISNNPKYKRGSIKKNLNTLMRYIKLATKNPFLSYDLPVGKSGPSKIKHIITLDELKNFVKYLNNEKLYVIIVICILMYKFGIRIGPLVKLKVNDLLQDDVIIFKEKNNLLIKRKLLKETSNILRKLINECQLNNDDYFFYYFKFPNDENQRTQFFIQKIRNILHESKSFSFSSLESLSSHIFRATYAVKSFQRNQIESIQAELGHKFAHTTINSYIKPERRELYLYEESNEKADYGIKALQKRIKKDHQSSKNNIKIVEFNDKDSLNLDEEGENYIDDDLNMNDSIFYFTGNFYEDCDIINYKNKIKMIEEKINTKNNKITKESNNLIENENFF